MNISFIGFVKFETKQYFTVFQDQFCVWLSLARLQTETVQVLFSHFLKITVFFSFFFLLHLPVQYLNKTLLYLIFYSVNDNFTPLEVCTTNSAVLKKLGSGSDIDHPVIL